VLKVSFTFQDICYSILTKLETQPSEVTPQEEKKKRVQHNMALADYFKNRAKDPFALLQKLKEINGE
jgi:hypothetical protein